MSIHWQQNEQPDTTRPEQHYGQNHLSAHRLYQVHDELGEE